ncbi:MAG TPA: hypothetical protein VLS89_04750 [Candidatus Nanopelagicales bacterium]|nr:hypothetical protein [Candidatus Nanopelagicales bacterium]
MARPELHADAIVVTGLAMHSVLGSLQSATAAARAGISLGRELGFSVLTSGEEDASVVGHPVASAAGFRGIGKLLCLAFPALEDLLRAVDFYPRRFDRTGLCLCLPNPDSWSARHVEPTTEGQAAEIPSSGPELCARLTRLTSVEIPEPDREHFDLGHAGLVHAVRSATARLTAGTWQRCILGAIDSLLEERALAWLLRSGRLKTPDKPDGLQPGEASVFLLLERYDSARRRGAEIMSVIGETAVASGGKDASALPQVVETVLGGPAGPPGGDRWLISDHNGESWRARELASTLVRLSSRFPHLGADARWLPASSFGDTGAVSAAIAVCLASRSFARGYAPAPAGVVLSSSDDGASACMRIHAPPAR